MHVKLRAQRGLPWLLTPDHPWIILAPNYSVHYGDGSLDWDVPGKVTGLSTNPGIPWKICENRPNDQNREPITEEV